MELTGLQIDQLKEIANIGAGNAATALSEILKDDIDIGVPESFVGDIEAVERVLGVGDDMSLAIYLKMQGGLSGALLTLFNGDCSTGFVSKLMDKKIDLLTQLTETDKSALQEVGNILFGSSITAFSNFLKLDATHSIPDIAVDMTGAIMDSVLLDIGAATETVLAFKVGLMVRKSGICCDLYFLFDPTATQNIFSATKVLLNPNDND